MSIEKILNDLVDSLPEIYGGFVCDEKQHILVSRLNLIESEQDCSEIAARIEKIRAMSSVHYTDINKFKLCFDNTNLLAYPIKSSLWLFISHSQDALPDLIQTTVDVAIKQLNQSHIHENENEKLTVEPNSADLSVELSATEKAIIKVVGPIGSILLEDAVTNWKSSDSFSPHLDTLFPFVQQELDDEKQYAKFLEIIKG